MQKMTEKFLLHASEIDRFSQLTVHLLQQMKINPRDILRFRLTTIDLPGCILRNI